MLRAMSQTMSKLRANNTATVCGGRDSGIRRERAAVTACSPSPVSHEWDGLTQWRSFIDSRRGLDADGKITASVAPVWDTRLADMELPDTLAEQAVAALLTVDPLEKSAMTHHAFTRFCSGGVDVGAANTPERPARSPLPELVPALQMPKPKETKLPLSVYMLHQLAHIELNAINLAWDTVARYSHLQLPKGFYEDFARVADDESRHFGWCIQRLAELGYKYGDMPAHDLLWEGCHASASDLSARLAIVPLSQEARGLDAGPRLATRLVGLGDNRSAAIVRRIAEEERAHVAVGVVWFKRVCEALGKDSSSLFRSQVSKINPDASLLKGPYNHDHRQEVGIPRDWYDIQEWPAEDKAMLLNKKYLTGPSYTPLKESQLSESDLELLKQRLTAFCDTERSLAHP